MCSAMDKTLVNISDKNNDIRKKFLFLCDMNIKEIPNNLNVRDTIYIKSFFYK